jgi:hypothetical protein
VRRRIFHGVPKEVTYVEIIEAVENCFGDKHLAEAYCSQLKTRTQCNGESLQGFLTAVEQSAHHSYPALTEDHARREAGSVDGLEYPDVKLQLLLGGKNNVN